MEVRSSIYLDETRRKVNPTGRKCNEGPRTLWKLDISKLEDSDLFVFIDESAIDSWNAGRSVVGGRSASCFWCYPQLIGYFREFCKHPPVRICKVLPLAINPSAESVPGKRERCHSFFIVHLPHL